MATLNASVKINAEEMIAASIEDFDLHTVCVLAVNKMVSEGITRHISYISPDDGVAFLMKDNGRVPRVKIEWVDQSETLPENHMESGSLS